ncbi:Scr1 family TA system antitoxin-like transcriptional regulator [Streptomyces sp. NPDC001020]
MANGSRQAAWEFFGAELKRQREDAGFTQVELGERVFVSGGYIGQFEQAIRKPQLDVAQRIDTVLQTEGFFERTWRKLIDDKRYADYFAAVAEMAAQLDHIAELARRRMVLVQVLPTSVGAYPLMGRMVRLFEFEDAPPTAYTEAVYSGSLLDDPALVKRVQGTYDLLRAAALPPEVSLALVESAAEDFRRCAGTT